MFAGDGPHVKGSVSLLEATDPLDPGGVHAPLGPQVAVDRQLCPADGELLAEVLAPTQVQLLDCTRHFVVAEWAPQMALEGHAAHLQVKSALQSKGRSGPAESRRPHGSVTGVVGLESTAVQLCAECMLKMGVRSGSRGFFKRGDFPWRKLWVGAQSAQPCDPLLRGLEPPNLDHRTAQAQGPVFCHVHPQAATGHAQGDLTECASPGLDRRGRYRARAGAAGRGLSCSALPDSDLQGLWTSSRT